MTPSPSSDLSAFRAHLSHCVGPRRDALYDLVDALSVAGPCPSLAHVSLAAPHRRGWGSLYAAPRHGQVDVATLQSRAPALSPHRRSARLRRGRECVAALRRSDQPARGFYYHPLRHLEGLPVVKGWAYHWIAQVPSKVASLDALEAAVARTGQCLLGRLAELAWADLDAQAVARYCAHEKPGTLVADGYETLFVASRFGTLERRRQVCAHRDSRPHIMPGNDLLPVHNGLLITRGLQEVACLLAQDLPFATAARLLGRQTGEPGVLSAANRRAEVLG